MQFGDYRVEIIPGGAFGLDGGAMFGVVPRVLWSRVNAPDEQNRIRMNTHCLYIEAGAEKILIETGMGDKWSDKYRSMYRIEQGMPLAERLQTATGTRAEEITIVVNTHLHFDHAGGNTTRDSSGEIVPTFPNARYFIAQGEYEHAENPYERDRASYMPDDWRILCESGQLELKPAEYEIAQGLTLETVTGHSRTMQCARLVQNNRTLYYFADIAPTRAHVPLAWIMGYDLYPLETLAAKKRLLPQAARENWLCVFPHDPDAPLCRVVDEDGKLRAVEAEIG
jgi:glyoxylase-like metal-dependent hydrolase (beta-lactamase superfamily II)